MKHYHASLSAWWQLRNCEDLGTFLCYSCWSTVPKNSRTAAGEFIAHLWWRWHTQHLSVDRPDLVTSCLFLVSLTRSLPWTTNATESKSFKLFSRTLARCFSCSFCFFLPHLTSKIAACPFLLPTSDSHKGRIYPDESILAWTDRSLLLLEWHPTKP